MVCSYYLSRSAIGCFNTIFKQGIMPEALLYRTYIGAILMHESLPGCPIFHPPESPNSRSGHLRAHLRRQQDNAALANQVRTSVDPYADPV